jgi:hypothetical protein
MESTGRKGPAEALYFSTGGSSRWVYVPVQGKPLIGGLRLPVGEKGDRRQRFDRLSMANPETVKQWRVTGPYALVEVEVNGGLGSPAGANFVATHMRMLDGTQEYPLQTAEVISRLRKGYSSWLQEQQRAIDAAMEAAQKKALSGRQPTGPRETAELLFVTWLPETQRLLVHFRTRVTDGAYRSAGPLEPAEPVRFGTPPREESKVRYGTTFGVELGLAYEVSKTGRLERTQALPRQTYQKEIAPPRPRGSVQ